MARQNEPELLAESDATTSTIFRICSFLFLSLHKKTDHTTFGMIRISSFSVVFSVYKHEHRNANADHQSQLCQRQVKAVFPMQFI